MPTTEFNDDKPALDYIRKRGYASYSSIKNVRDCVVPTVSNETWFKFGHELHSRFLEGKKTETLSALEETTLANMVVQLKKNVVVQQLMAKSQKEIDFGPAAVLKKYNSRSGIVVPHIYGLPVYGRIDILNTDSIADLKTTKLAAMRAFVKAMDFLQAAVYLTAVPRKDFYYIGQSKVVPYTVMPFSANSYPALLDDSHRELKSLCKYIAKKL